MGVASLMSLMRATYAGRCYINPLFKFQHNRFVSCYEKCQHKGILLPAINTVRTLQRCYTQSVTEAEADGTNALFVWDDGKTSRFHSKWLRFNCRCPVCVDRNTNQCRIEVDKVPIELTLKDVNIAGKDTINVTWKEDSHEGSLPTDYLREYCQETIRKERVQSKPKFFFDNKIPKLSWKEVEQSDEKVFRWLRFICDQGLCLLTDVPTDRNSILKVMRTIGCPTETLYGEIFDVKTMKTATNHAYDSYKLDYHMDLLFYESSPGIQLLHCLRFDDTVTGGETLFLDMFHIVDEFRKVYPEKFETLCEVPVTHWRIHYNREQPAHMLYRRRTIEVNDMNEVIAVSWNPPTMGPPVTTEDKVPEYYDALQFLGKMINTFPYRKSLRYKEGDMICFNNKRMLHGRNAFEGGDYGSRHLQGGYVNIDDFKSRLSVLTQKYEPGMTIPRVGNSDLM